MDDTVAQDSYPSNQKMRTFSKEAIQNELKKDRSSYKTTFKERSLGDILLEDGYFSREEFLQIDKRSSIFENYTVIDKIGGGRFGILYKAKQHNCFASYFVSGYKSNF